VEGTRVLVVSWLFTKTDFLSEFWKWRALECYWFLGLSKRSKSVEVFKVEGSGVWMVLGSAQVHTGVLELEGAGMYQLPREFFVSSIGIERNRIFSLRVPARWNEKG